MTPICNHIVDHPSAWTPATIGDKNGLKLALSEQELAAIETLLERTRGKRPQEVTRADFDHPTVNRLLDRIPLLPRNIAHSDEQHEAIVIAILAGDAEGAAVAMRAHIEGTAVLLHGFLD